MIAIKFLYNELMSNITKLLASAGVVFCIIMATGIVEPPIDVDVKWMVLSIMFAGLCELIDINKNIMVMSFLHKIEFKSKNIDINKVLAEHDINVVKT